ncbi:preprotein translocase subunit YajC [Clostridium tarantellae]|uniref:Preprotein translocase subunit YajC n=1 Tax=Clostridium tarantellae TaxID=39493 RepID=A0A6I1MU27_9CLOT|nr:preprotein translocase subunit YajC [Clostridium tarantellae]MPQ43739.1 preprotein translocase subunit YajC [Clostridium tarantellae]
MSTFLTVILVIIALFLFWYIISFRGVNKQKAAIIEEQSKVKVGANIILANGIHGKINKLNEKTADIVIDQSKNVIIKIDRVAIAKVI